MGTDDGGSPVPCMSSSIFGQEPPLLRVLTPVPSHCPTSEEHSSLIVNHEFFCKLEWKTSMSPACPQMQMSVVCRRSTWHTAGDPQKATRRPRESVSSIGCFSGRATPAGARPYRLPSQVGTRLVGTSGALA